MSPTASDSSNRLNPPKVAGLIKDGYGQFTISYHELELPVCTRSKLLRRIGLAQRFQVRLSPVPHNTFKTVVILLPHFLRPYIPPVSALERHWL